MIAKLNPVLREWATTSDGNADRKFNQLDTYVYERLARWMVRRAGQRKARIEKWPMIGSLLWVCTVCGTVKYPVQATQRRSSLSRVQENCTHGLRGVC